MLGLDVPLRLATVDTAGMPHITPLWFEWDEGAFWMTSLSQRPHIRRLRLNPSASVCIDVEAPERSDGERPNRQVRGVGTVTLAEDVGGRRTERITRKYLSGPGLEDMVRHRTSLSRVVLSLRPDRLIAIASV